MASRDASTPYAGDSASDKAAPRGAGTPELQLKKSWLAAVILLAIMIRAFLIATSPDQLLDDRDAYLALSTEIVEGRGLVSTSDGTPTAFRPPLVPVTLALLRLLLSESLAVLVLNLSATAITVVSAISIARKTGVRHPETAGILVALDPTLIAYSTLPMTEVPSAALVTMLFALRFCWKPSTGTLFLCGIASGLLLLCRPSFWPAILLLLMVWSRGRSTAESGSVSVRRPIISAATLVAGILLLVVPWIVRNAIQLQVPIFTTTHGGYTLHLGNNANFFADVASDNWRTIWSEADFQTWENENLQAMIATGAEGSEILADQWHYRAARSWIGAHPVEFMTCCVVRVCRFWALRPLRLPTPLDDTVITSAISLWYFFLFAGSLAGGWMARHHSGQLVVSIAIIATSLTAVHAIYWSNMRFRAPLNPLLMILLCFAVDAISRKRQLKFNA